MTPIIMRVHEVARFAGVPSQQVLWFARTIGHTPKSASSRLYLLPCEREVLLMQIIKHYHTPAAPIRRYAARPGSHEPWAASVSTCRCGVRIRLPYGHGQWSTQWSMSY